MIEPPQHVGMLLGEGSLSGHEACEETAPEEDL